MRKLWLKIFVNLILVFSVSSFAWADVPAAPNKTLLMSQQIDLLKARLAETQNQLKLLQAQHDSLTADSVNKKLLSQTQLDLAVAKSNLDSVNIELFESQQAVTRVEKSIQDIQNQLNVFNIFGMKIAQEGRPNINRMHTTLNYLQNLLILDKARVSYLLKLQALLDNALQLHKAKYNRIELLLKSQTILQLRERQARAEYGIQQQQSDWLRRLNLLNMQLVELQNNKQYDKAVYEKLQNDIFYANENINFTYLEILIARYQEQIQQLKISVAQSSSITLLNKATDQLQSLGKQLGRVNNLLKGRLEILTQRQDFFAADEGVSLMAQYKTAGANVVNLNRDLIDLRKALDQALQQELSARQGLPMLGSKAWINLGGEMLVVPTLTFQVMKSLGNGVLKTFTEMTWWGWAGLGTLQLIWWLAFGVLSYWLKRIVGNIPDHEFGHINLKWLTIKLLQRNWIDIALIGNVIWFFMFCEIPAQNYDFFINLSLVWLFFKSLNVIARLGLIETVHDREGHDVRLYRKLRWIFWVGGIVTALTVFMYQLPIIYELKDLFNRLFLLFLLVASVLLLRQWELVPRLLLPHIDERHTYARRIILLLGLLVPLVLLVNSLIGLLGFVNLIFTISWYESVFILVLVGYLIIRGFLGDGMELASKILIRHVTNGWLWTEAFLKPVDRMLRISLFLAAWVVLFLLYGWDQQSPVVERLNKLLSYHLIDMLNTSITPLSIIELAVVISLLYWAVRWTREFVYRLLLSRTKDLGLRNSLAILSQYAMIVVGVFICLRMLGIDYRSLTFAVTAFAFGVGLGLRDLFNNFASGFLLLLERPLRVGDIVSINNYEGEVTHIGGRAVTVRTWDHMDVLVPNAEIFSKSFMNWTAKDNVIRAVISLKINRHDSPHDVQAVIQQVLSQHKDVLTDPAPEVFLKELADGLIEFEVRYFINVRQVKSRVGLRSEVLMAIWEAFERHGIQAPYPQHEVYVKNT